MTRVFVYARVSSPELTTENQMREVESAGFTVEPRRVVTETISGGVPAFERPGFAKLVDRLEDGDVLVVTKLDRLGRNAIDIRQTVEALAERGVRTHCLQLGGADLTSTAGKLIMAVIGAMAEFERDLIIERTKAGVERARKAGRLPGRPARLDAKQRAAVASRLADGASVRSLSIELGVDRTVIRRCRAEA